MKKHKCVTCEKQIEDGKAYVDGYFGQIHCSWKCLVEYMAEFFDVTENKPNVTVINGEYHFDDEFDKDGNLLDHYK